jgi:hypothetical protein
MKVYGLDRLTLRQVPSWQFPPTTFIKGTQRVQVKDWHTLYDAEVAQALCLKRTGRPEMQEASSIMIQKAFGYWEFWRGVLCANSRKLPPRTFVAAEPPDGHNGHGYRTLAYAKRSADNGPLL